MDEAGSTTERLMVVVDGAPGTKRTVDYVARMIGRQRGFHVYLLHLLPPMPAELLEFGGAEDPREEQKMQAELQRDQQAWIASVREQAKPALEEAIKALLYAGLARHEIDLEYSDPMDDQDARAAVLSQARADRCQTIVLGHDAPFWFRELAGGHLTERLLRHANEVTIWVVQ
jgi:nucleotide-binding universal stress UspA family protein